MHLRMTVLMLLVSVALAGCGGSSTSSDSGGKTPVSWLAAEMPAGAIPVTEARRTAREGQQIVVRGRIGGRRDPMTEGFAVFVMMDSALPACGEGCKKPWDYCCETPDTIMSNSATVQVVGNGDKALAVDLAEHGFAPLDEVVVIGTVAPPPADSVLIIHASKIHRVKG